MRVRYPFTSVSSFMTTLTLERSPAPRFCTCFLTSATWASGKTVDSGHVETVRLTTRQLHMNLSHLITHLGFYFSFLQHRKTRITCSGLLLGAHDEIGLT